MKKTILLFTALIFSTLSFSQDCSDFFSFRPGVMWEQQTFSAKDKLESITGARVLEVTPTAEGIASRIEMSTSDPDNEKKTSFEVGYRCENGVFQMDMQDILNHMNLDLDKFEGLEATIETTAVEYPSVLVPGTTLADASYTVSMSMGGMTMMSVSINLIDRKVVAEENITVPAGSFKASKITYTIEANMGFTKTHLNVTEWMSKKAGVVRSETYDKKGKLQDYTVLSKFVEK